MGSQSLRLFSSRPDARDARLSKTTSLILRSARSWVKSFCQRLSARCALLSPRSEARASL